MMKPCDLDEYRVWACKNLDANFADPKLASEVMLRSGLATLLRALSAKRAGLPARRADDDCLDELRWVRRKLRALDLIAVLALNMALRKSLLLSSV